LQVKTSYSLPLAYTVQSWRLPKCEYCDHV
jgi:hypothetical protein